MQKLTQIARYVLAAAILCALLALLMIAAFRLGDRRFDEVGATMGTATGLGRIGELRVLAQPHTGPNYLMKEMIHVVGRKHAKTLRRIAVTLAAVLPGLMLLFLPPHPVVLGAIAVIHLIGAFAARWLFFAEAEHVVGLYYGRQVGR